MKQSKFLHLLLPVMIMAIPWVYLAVIWNSLPQTIPTHFGLEGKPDAFGKKTEVIVAPLVMTITGIFVYLLLKNIHRIDPKKKYSSTTSAIMSKIAFAVIVLLAAVTMFILYWTIKGRVEGIPAFFCGLSLFFAYLGNLMHSVRPNYFVGFRIPWALENEENWTKTHRLASKIWFTGGISLAIFSLLAGSNILLLIVFFCTVFLMTIIPVIYSYNLYRLANRTGNKE